MKRLLLNALHVVCLSLTLAGISAAQLPTTGTPPFGSFGGGPFDTVDLGNLNVNFKIPVLHKAGRGMPFAYDITYDSSVWYPAAYSGSHTWVPSSTRWGWQGVAPTVYTANVTYTPTYYQSTCGMRGEYVWHQWTFGNFVAIDNYGTSHNFNYSPSYVTSNDPNSGTDHLCPPTQVNPPNPIPTTASDGSGYTLYATPGDGTATAYVTSASGMGIYPGNTTDANGNEITSSGGVYTDTLGQTALTAAGSGTPASPVTLTYAVPGGTFSAKYTVNYTSYTVKTNFGCSGVSEYAATAVNLVSDITLPDGSKYLFTYEQTPGFPGDVTGRIWSVTLPTGGQIIYNYIDGSQGIVCTDGSTAGLKRVLTPGGTWKYDRALQSGNHWQTTVTDPTAALNQTVIDFQQDSSAGTANFFETERQSYSGSVGGTVLSAAITCYNTANPTPGNCPAATVSTPISRRTVFPYLPNVSTSSKVAETDTQFSYINDPSYPTEIDSYDYGTGSPPTTPLRKVTTQYSAFGNTVQPTSVQIQDGSGTTKALTTYSYDQTTPTAPVGTTPQHVPVTGGRGNLTTLASQASGSVTLYRKFSYYDTGNVQTASDAGTTTAGGANLTTYNYPDATSTCGNAFPGSISEPLTLSKSFTWNCTGAVQLTATDENNQTSTTYYTGSNFTKSADPSFWRPYATTDQLGNPTTLSYTGQNAFERTLAFNGNASVSDNRSTLDGFGRSMVSQVQQGYNAANYDSTETDYDIAGRVSRSTRPYSATAGTTCPACAASSTTYDAVNRPLTVTDGGGGTVNYTYTKNDTLTAVGPAPGNPDNLKQKQLEYDGLGRLASVCEITTGTGTGSCNQSAPVTGFWTQYTYDALGDTTVVSQNSQPGASATQTRTYTYDMLGRLLSEVNPETLLAATTYTYDTADASCSSYTSAGDMVEKKDAVGNYSCYQYDGLHRVTSITYPSGSYSARTDQKHYVYDSATVGGTAMGNARSRLAEAYTCGASCSPKKTDIGFSYSARGEVTDAWESTPNSGGYYHPATTFWANGALKTLWISSLPVISYGADGEGRPSTVAASSGQNPVTTTAYNTSSQVTGVTYGSADSDSYGFDANTGRMTQYKFTVNGSSEIGNLTWNPNGSLKTTAITDPFNAGDSQTCNYVHDDLSRVSSANCGTPWSQTFSFDPFGNVTKSGSISWQPGYTQTTNRYALGGTSYDANGNLLNDTFHAYTWDSENKAVKIDAINLTYDAFDRMVEQNPSAGQYYQIVYTPMGTKLGLFKAAVIQQLYVPLPGGAQAEYYSWGLSDYRHVDWLGSDRLESSTTRTIIDNNAYAPYGEPYAQTGNGEISFTGQNKDTDWLQYDFMARQYDPKQGRWISPDPAGMGAVDPANPQTWNRYAYVINSPLNFTDLLGLELPCSPAGDGIFCFQTQVNAGILCAGITVPSGQGSRCVDDCQPIFTAQGSWKGTPCMSSPVIVIGTDSSIDHPSPDGGTSDGWGLTFTKSFFLGFSLFGPKNDPRPSCFGGFLKDSAANFVGLPGVDTVAAGAMAHYAVSQSGARAVPGTRALRGGVSPKQWLEADEAARVSKAGRFSLLVNADYAMGQALFEKELPAALAGECK